jgi:predicted RNase H-related nuclease YkuK (DUF458 family)
MKFKSLTNNEWIEDTISYIKNYCSTHRDVKIYLGCDSQTRYEHTNYVITIVLHKGNFGCHVLYNKSKVDVIKSIYQKLWKEVELVTSVGVWLIENKITVHHIDLDFNSQKDSISNKLVKSAVGYIEAHGLKCMYKPAILPAVKAADLLLR